MIVTFHCWFGTSRITKAVSSSLPACLREDSKKKKTTKQTCRPIQYGMLSFLWRSEHESPTPRVSHSSVIRKQRTGKAMDSAVAPQWYNEQLWARCRLPLTWAARAALRLLLRLELAVTPQALAVRKGSVVFCYTYSILSLFRWYQIFYTIDPLKKKNSSLEFCRPLIRLLHSVFQIGWQIETSCKHWSSLKIDVFSQTLLGCHIKQ